MKPGVVRRMLGDLGLVLTSWARGLVHGDLDLVLSLLSRDWVLAVGEVVPRRGVAICVTAKLPWVVRILSLSKLRLLIDIDMRHCLPIIPNQKLTSDMISGTKAPLSTGQLEGRTNSTLVLCCCRCFSVYLEYRPNITQSLLHNRNQVAPDHKKFRHTIQARQLSSHRCSSVVPDTPPKLQKGDHRNCRVSLTIHI